MKKKSQNLKKTVFIALFSIISGLAHGKTCWDAAAAKYNLDPWWLFTIASIESGFDDSGVVRKNTNGSYDVGMMQINTIHKNELKKQGIDIQDVRFNTCQGIHFAAKLLADSIKRYGLNIDGIGGYHSNTPHLRQKYGKKALKRYQFLVKEYYVNKKPFKFQKTANKTPQTTAKNIKPAQWTLD